MSLDYSYKDIEWCQGLFHKSDECFCDANIIVPDSMDDIAKTICVKAIPSVSDSKCENGKITVNGQVKITLLYIGENESGKIFTLSTSQPFSHVINAPEVTGEHLSLVTVCCCSVNHSLVNSRRLKLTASLRFLASSYKNNRAKILGNVTGAEFISGEKSFICARTICTKSIIITDNIDIGAGKAPITTILKHNVRIADSDFKPLNNKVIAKGNIALSLLYSSEGTLSDAAVTIPFTEVLEAEGVSPSAITKVSPFVADCEIRPDTDLSGEYKMLEVNIVLTCHITAFTKEKVTAVTDLYLPGGALNKTVLPVTITDSIEEITQEEFFKDSITLPPTLPPISRIVDIECHIGDTTLSAPVASANAEITLLYLSPATSSLNTYTAKIPLTHNCALENVKNPRFTLNHIGYAITGDNALEVRLSANFTAICDKAEQIDIINDCVEEKYTPPHRSSVIVSFVNPGDSLWSIAKKYNIPLSSLASANAIDKNAILTVGEKLIIPR